MSKITRTIGLAGVAEDENPTARACGKFLSLILMAAILLLAFKAYLDWRGYDTYVSNYVANSLVWAFFIIESYILVYLVDNKRRFLKENWLNIVIIAIGLPLMFIDHGPLSHLLRILRFTVLSALLIPWTVMCIRFLSDNRLDTTIVAAITVLVLSGIIITEIEPSITSVGDGIWWAWVTISTVGYGDIVPTSAAGRTFSALLILLGIGIFAVMTANFAALFVSKNVEKVKEQQEEENRQLRKIIENISEMRQEEEDTFAKLNAIEKRLNHIEDLTSRINVGNIRGANVKRCGSYRGRDRRKSPREGGSSRMNSRS